MRAATFAAGVVTGFAGFASLCYAIGRAEQDRQRQITQCPMCAAAAAARSMRTRPVGVYRPSTQGWPTGRPV